MPDSEDPFIMKTTCKALVAALVLGVGLVAAPAAEASHIWFLDVKGNGIDLVANPGYIFTTPTVQFDVTVSSDPDGSPAGVSFPDTLNFDFSGAIADASAAFGTSPGNILISVTRVFATPYVGTLTLDIPTSFPDYQIPTTGQQVDTQTFSFQVQAVPEPATLALFGFAAAGAGARAWRRRRTTR
jgi:hypothetical protein